MAGPLEGITILDLTWVLSGPFGAMVLCDLGAEVIKVERPPHGDLARTTGPHLNGVSGYFMSINRGKKSVSIDLAKEEGKELFQPGWMSFTSIVPASVPSLFHSSQP